MFLENVGIYVQGYQITTRKTLNFMLAP